MKLRNFIYLVLIALLVPVFSNAQAIVKGSGILYTNGAPTHSVSQNVDSEIALDTTTGLFYLYYRDLAAWGKAGFFIRKVAISVAPTGAPTDKESELVINDVDSIYNWRAGAWRHVNPGGDPSITNEGQIGVGAGGATSSVITSNTSGATGVTINVAGINSISETTSANGGQITITATEVDGSTSNELQTYAHSGTTSYTNTLSNGGGSFILQATGIASISHSSGTVTISATEVDGSVTNEGQIGVGAGGATSSVLTSNTSGAVGVTINVGGINTISESTSANGGSITITATEVDGSTTNELQTITNTSDATSHTVTLSNSGGSVQLVEGTGITLTTTGTGSAGVVTIASTSTGTTDLSYTGTSSPVTLNSSTGNDVTFTQGGIVTISATGTNMTISATEVDGSTSNELQTYSHSGTTTYTNTLSNGGGTWSITGAGIAVISQTAGAITVTATEVDGSTTNELQTITNTSDATSHTVTLSNSGGSIQLVEGANITLTTTGTGAAGVVTIAATSGGGTDLSYTGTSSPVTLNSSSGTDVTFTQGGIVTITGTATDLTISATEVDGSASNEGSITVGAGGSNDSQINSNTSGSGSVTISGGNGMLVTESGSTITVSPPTGTSGQTLRYDLSGVLVANSQILNNGTEVGIGGSPISGIELYTAGRGRFDATIESQGTGTPTGGTGAAAVRLINTTPTTGQTWYVGSMNDGTFVLQSDNASTVLSSEVDGTVATAYDFKIGDVTGITPTTIIGRDANGLVGTVGVGAGLSLSGGTLSATGSGTTDLTFSGVSSPVTLNSSSGTDVTFTAGGINSFSATGTNITITATEVDGSTSNELQTYSHAGTTTYTNTLSNGGGSWSITGAGIAVISQTAGAVTVTATEVDGSVTNEGQVGVGAGGATSSVITSNTSGATGVTINVGGINSISETTSANGGQITITATEVDGSVTNEGQVGVGAGGATSSVITSNTSGAVGVTINVGGINSITESTSANGGSITITATEVDGSTSNELQTITNSSDATSHTVTLSNSGGSVQLVEGSNITLTTSGTGSAGVVTIAATEVDGSVTNEGQIGVGAGGATSSVITSNTSGAVGVTINVGGINSITESTSANGGSITITATEVDGSTSNELQTVNNTSNATTHTVTLSNSGGSIQLAEGSNITLTTTGTAADGVVTIASTAGATDLTFSGTSSPVTLNSSTGTDVTFTAGGINSFSASGTNITITATEVDGSTTNEVVTISDGLNSEAMGGQTLTVSGGGINTASYNGVSNTLTITGTEVDGSTSNELQTITNTSDATSHTVTLSNSGGSIQLVEGSNITLTTSGTGSAGVVTIAATGGGGTPAGANYQVQYYNSGAFGAENVFNYDPTNNRLVVGHTAAAAVLHGRGANDVSDRVFLAENLTGNDILAVYSQGNVKFGDNETYPIIRQTNTAGGTTTYTGNGITFESQPTATTTDVFSFYHPSVGLGSGTNNIVRETGTWSVASGTGVYNAITADPTINVNTTATGVVNIFNATPTVTQAAGGIRMFNATPSVTAASGGLSGYYSNIASGTNIYGVFADGTAQSRFDGSVGIKLDPSAGYDLHVTGPTRVNASIESWGTGTPTGSNAAAAVRLVNTTGGTGQTWYVGSLNDGTFALQSGNANNVLTADVDGTVKTVYDFRIGDVTAITPTTVIGRDADGDVGTVTLGSGVALSGGELPLWNSNDAGSLTSLTSTALANVTGLSFDVTNGLEYEFWATIKYSAAATTTGSAWSIDCPAGTVQLQVESGLTNSTTFNHWQNAENTLLASASSVYTSGNVAFVRGIFEATATGTCILRGATEVNGSAITVQGTSVVNWREIK